MNKQTKPETQQTEIDSAQALAEACANKMWNADNASKALNMKLESISPGSATLSMKVTDSMTNGHKTGHGGFLFTLADSAFAFACNSFNDLAVAQHCSITFLAPARMGDQLTASASAISRSGRSGIYDVRITNQHNECIAEFRGHSRTIKGCHI